MALSGTRAADEYIARGPTTVADIATSRRLYDRSDKIVFKERASAPLYNIFYRKMQKISVSDPEPKANEEQETPLTVTPTTSQSAAGHKYYIEVSLVNGRMINVDDKFVVSGIYFDGSSTYGTSFGSYGNEVVIVTAVENGKTLAGAASSTKSRLTVLRGNGTNADPGTNYITTAMTLTKLGNSVAENGTYPSPWSVDLGTQQNYIEEKLITWGQSWIQDHTKVLVPGDEQRKARRARSNLMTYIENTLFFGRKQIIYDNGQPKRMTGGALEFIPTSDIDGNSHFIDFGGSFALNTLNEKLVIPMTYGNKRKEKWAACSMNVLTYYTNAFNGLIRLDPDYSGQYGIDIVRHKAPAGTINMFHEPLLDFVGGTYANAMVILDLDYLMPMHMDGLDVQVLDNLQDNGTRGWIKGIYATFGLWRTFADAHSVIYNITAP